MHIHIHQPGGHFQAQNTAREFTLHQCALVGIFHGRHHRSVFHIAAVDVKILCAPAGTAGAGRRDQAMHAVSALGMLCFHQVTGKAAPQRGIGGAAQASVAGGHKLLLALADKSKRDLRV